MHILNLFHGIKKEVPLAMRMKEAREKIFASYQNYPTGRGVGIAILDTGISPVADFTTPQNRIVAFKDFINWEKSPYDDNGHGTHVRSPDSYRDFLFFHLSCTSKNCCFSIIGVWLFSTSTHSSFGATTTFLLL